LSELKSRVNLNFKNLYLLKEASVRNSAVFIFGIFVSLLFIQPPFTLSAHSKPAIKKSVPKKRPAPISSEEQLKKMLISKLSTIFPKIEIEDIFSDKRLLVDRSIVQFKPLECELADGTRRLYTGYFDPDCGILIPRSLQRGADFIAKYKESFDKAYDKYGVEAAVIAAILRVETNFGSYIGRYPVLIALYTRYILTPSRRNMALEQIEFFLRLSKMNGWDPFEVRGSSWGAIGMPQFMPFSYWYYGVDGNGDGKVDLFDVEDAIHSAARYLAEHGWSDKATDQRNALWAYNRDKTYVNAVLAYAMAIKNMIR
jgi:hypothetical protein